MILNDSKTIQYSFGQLTEISNTKQKGRWQVTHEMQLAMMCWASQPQ